MATAGRSVRADPEPASAAGPAHVAVVSFLASRVVPSGGFWLALAGGVALARVAERRNARQSYGASIAAMLETVAIIGPLRFGVPLTQAVTAPLLGRLEARGVAGWAQMLVCGVLRLAQNTLQTAFFIWVIAGGLDAYAGAYDAIGSRLGLNVGNAETLVLTAVGLLAWAAFASVVQVLVYRRGLARWDATPAEEPSVAASDERAPAPSETADAGNAGTMFPELARRGDASAMSSEPGDLGAASAASSAAVAGAAPVASRFDPRLLALAAVVLFALLLARPTWPVLAGVAAFLALAWAVSRPDPAPLPVGLAFTALLAGSVFVLALVAGLGLEVALRRGLRAALLVLTATWLRAAARAEGLRFVFRRALQRLRRIPSVPEAASVLDSLSSEERLAASGRAFAASLQDGPRRPVPFVDAVLGWVVREASAPHPPPRQSV
jgi:hypothetical protein